MPDPSRVYALHLVLFVQVFLYQRVRYERRSIDPIEFIPFCGIVHLWTKVLQHWLSSPTTISEIIHPVSLPGVLWRNSCDTPSLSNLAKKCRHPTWRRPEHVAPSRVLSSDSTLVPW